MGNIPVGFQESASFLIFAWEFPCEMKTDFRRILKKSSRQLDGFAPESTAGFFRVARTIKVVHAFKAEMVAFRGIRGRNFEKT